MLADLSEAALIEACLAGRSGAFDLVVERHRRSVYQLCRRFVGNHEDASDLSQDIFVRAYKGLRSFRGQSSLATWLYRIGVNVCLNRVSAKAPLEKMTEAIEDRQYVDTRNESASERLLKEERRARVRAAIAELPRKQRATLILRMYHEMSHQEIADVLGSSVGAVKANFFHALGNLKKQLGSEDV
ncbi:MAG TPA: RNA polymerase sigma factor [Vicinamibacterales bacterium]